ncbi:polyketide cyclase [Mycolicibacterium chubuense]|nr:polyketide cyclase [Mycolicibacterium chubuense]
MGNRRHMRQHELVTRHGRTATRGSEGHRALYLRWINELWAGEPIARELVSADFVGHWPTRDIHGPDELQALVDDTRRELRELMFVVDVGPFGDGDLMAARWISTGSTKRGPARFTGNDIVRVADGRIVEYWTGATPG